jgi:hypothetical protein
MFCGAARPGARRARAERAAGYKAGSRARRGRGGRGKHEGKRKNRGAGSGLEPPHEVDDKVVVEANSGMVHME